MQTVSASDLQARIGEVSDLARREPVTVTQPGRPSLVLLSAEDYERLKRLEDRATRAVRTPDLPATTIDAMLDADLSHLPAE